MVTISAVEVSADFAYSKVFYTTLGAEGERDQVDTGLRRASGFLRKELGKRLRIHNIPELRFIYDQSIEHGVYLSQLIDRAIADDTGRKD